MFHRQQRQDRNHGGERRIGGRALNDEHQSQSSMNGARDQRAVGAPPGLPLMRMQWRDLLFMHWPVPVEVIRPLIPRPDRLQIDTFDGMAWVGLVPFTMRCVQPWVIP